MVGKIRINQAFVLVQLPLCLIVSLLYNKLSGLKSHIALGSCTIFLKIQLTKQDVCCQRLYPKHGLQADVSVAKFRVSFFVMAGGYLVQSSWFIEADRFL